MSEPLDHLLRRALTRLDDEAPPAYFDTLADRTLARLDAAPAPRRARWRFAVAGAALALAAVVTLIVTWGRAPDAARPRAESASPAPARRSDDVAGGAADAGPRAVAGGQLPANGSAAGSGAGSSGRPDPRPAPVDDRQAPPPSQLNEPPVKPAPIGKAKPVKPVGKQRGKAARYDPDDGEPGKTVTPRAADGEPSRVLAARSAAARACYAGTPGEAAVRVVIDADGGVRSVVVSGPFAGTPVGACVERAVAGARFAPASGVPRVAEYRYQLSE